MTEPGRTDTEIRPFRIDIPQPDLDDLHDRRRYWILAVIIIHVLGIQGAVVILTIMLVGALFQI